MRNPFRPATNGTVYGFYTVYLKEVKCGDLRYGRNYYDYQEGTLVFLAPGQVIELRGQAARPISPKAGPCCSIPTCCAARRSGATSAGYSFFSYEVSEALHLSEQERNVVVDCLQNIQSRS